MNLDKTRSHEEYMEQLIELAKVNPKAPFSAFIVNHLDGEVLCQGLNNSATHPTHHGEMVAINNFVEKYPHRTFENTTLYTTAEPCPMCMSAIIWARIPLCVYGTSIQYLIEHGWGQIAIPSQEVAERATFHQCQIISGVLRERTDSLFINRH
ncbi:MAG: nucleoside deaminase [Bacteroidota bacterium]